MESASSQIRRLRDERDQARTDNDRIRVENEALRLCISSVTSALRKIEEWERRGVSDCG